MLPAGMILLWFGSIANIPVGWLFCNGSNGTPDLRNKFVRGANVEDDVGFTGGADIHNHDFTSGTHTHGIPAGPDIDAGIGYMPESSPETVTGTTDNGSTLPPYHGLAYIMKS